MQKIIKLLSFYVRILFGKCYFHLPQGIGKAFKPDKLEGYFSDMTGKINWQGLLDEDGIPVNQLFDGSTCYFPITIAQKALGHYDKYLLENDKEDLKEFIKICDWLVKMQDEKGGWEIKDILNLTENSKYSAMSQGEAISVLARAWKLFHNEKYIRTAEKAYNLMVTPVENGGTAYFRNNGGIYLEEFPTIRKNTILNGWIFALFGIHDLCLATDNEVYKKYFNQSYQTLLNNLHIFDAGFWSYYDEKKAVASPFYHNLHISQLEALYLVKNDEKTKNYIEKWQGYRRSVLKRYCAFIIKAFQKMRKPYPAFLD